MKSTYILLTDTGTVLTKCIKLFTRKNYNHSSIALDQQLDNVYSFGRKKVTNPFDGGFVKENLYQDFFLRAKCQVFRFDVTDEQYELLQTKLSEFELEKSKYRYNLIGLIGIALHQNWERENAFFCSQFLAYILEECEMGTFDKPCYLVTPADLIQTLDPQIVYQGTIMEYLMNHESYANDQGTVYQVTPQTSFVKRLGLPIIGRFLG